MPLESELDDALEPIVRVLSEPLETTINGHAVTAYIEGDRELVTWGQTKGGIPIAYEGPPMEKAISYAQKHGAKLVTQMDTETKRRLAQTVSGAIKNKRGIPGLARDIRGTFDNMSKYRSEMIARTETASALSQASLDRMEAMGVDGKEWVTVGDDRVSPECRQNEADGIIPVDQAFSSGAKGPPQHPSCRCALAPARLPITKAPPKALKPKPPTKAVPTGPEGDAWKKILTTDEAGAMRGWTADGYIPMRELQRTGKATAQIRRYTKAFEKGLSKDGSYKGEVFRGMGNLDAKTYNLIKNSKTITLDSTSSSSISSRQAANFARGAKTNPNRIIYRIDSKTGVDFRTFNPGEQEILLGRGTKYKVVSQKRKVFQGLGKEKVDALEMVLAEI